MFQVCKIMNEARLLEGAEKVFAEWREEAEALENVIIAIRSSELASLDISSKEKVHYPEICSNTLPLIILEYVNKRKKKSKAITWGSKIYCGRL